MSTERAESPAEPHFTPEHFADFAYRRARGRSWEGIAQEFNHPYPDRLRRTLEKDETFQALVRTEKRALRDEAEADALGVAMARLEPERARSLFAKWVTPKGMIGRFMALPGQRIQWWGAVSGLAMLPGEVEPLIRGLFDRVDEDLRQHCVAVLVRRRKRQLGAT